MKSEELCYAAVILNFQFSIFNLIRKVVNNMTYEEIRGDHAVNVYIAQADKTLEALGFTEHSFPHVTRVAKAAGDILLALGHSPREVELAKIAGFLHDIGNVVNRVDHSQSGAVMAFRILDRMNFPPEEIAAIVSAIGNHDEGTGVPVSPLAAALILADKSDVRRSRVRKKEDIESDIHDRVNYAVTDSSLLVLPREGQILLDLTIDTGISAVMDYFEIFMKRMLLCRKAAQKLGCAFHLKINGQIVA